MSSQIQYKKEDHVNTQILELLEDSDLPTSDLGKRNTNITFFSAFLEDSEENLLGVVALKAFKDEAILRSLAVKKDYQKRGIGKDLVDHLEQYAVRKSIKELFLLTETADTFFERLDYNIISSNKAPEKIQRSSQFSQLCPSSAICMHKKINA